MNSTGFPKERGKEEEKLETSLSKSFFKVQIFYWRISETASGETRSLEGGTLIPIEYKTNSKREKKKKKKKKKKNEKQRKTKTIENINNFSIWIETISRILLNQS